MEDKQTTEATKQRDMIHRQDVAQVGKLAKAFENHICDYDELKLQILELMPLTELIVPLQEIVDNKKTDQAVNLRIAKYTRISLAVIAGTGVVIGTIFTLVQLIFRLKE
jgi:hypothetical protein